MREKNSPPSASRARNLLHQLQPWLLLDMPRPQLLSLLTMEVTEDAGSALAFQLLYSGNFEGFVQKNQLNEVRVGWESIQKTSPGSWHQIRALIRR